MLERMNSLRRKASPEAEIIQLEKENPTNLGLVMPLPIKAKPAELMERTSLRLTRTNRTGRLPRLTGITRTKSGGLCTLGLWRGGLVRKSLPCTSRILVKLRD